MGRPTFVTVCGSGSAGMAIAGDLALMGCKVNLFDVEEFRKSIEPIADKGGIELTADESQSGRAGFAKLNMATTNPREAVENVDLIMVAAPAYGHEAFFKSISPFLQERQKILVNTGYFASLRFAGMLRKKGIFDKITVAEANIMPYLSSKTGSVTVHIFRYKRQLFLSAFPSEKTAEILKVVKLVYPQHNPVPNILWTNFNCLNSPLHATFTIPIASLLFDRYKGCKFYGETTLCGARLVEAFDNERIAVGKTLGCDVTSTAELIEKTYGYKGKDLGQAMRRSDHAEDWVSAQGIINLCEEDICYFYIPLIGFGELFGIPTPTTRAITYVLSIMLGTNYWERGVTLKDLGLEGLTKDQILKYVTLGELT